MNLSELIERTRADPAVEQAFIVGDASVEVGAPVADSRLVESGSVFCCVPGAVADGHDHAAAAVAAGAAALVCERPLDLGVPTVQVSSVRRAMGPISATWWGSPSDQLAVTGVTGTNGKTTVVHLLAAILDAADIGCGSIGTLTGARTTPEAPDLQHLLAEFRDQGRAAVAMEVSSHALDLHRVDGTHFRVAIFTNLSRDHLDHHGDMASYFQAKARLFEPGMAELAVLNLDDPHGRLLNDAARIPSIGFSLDDALDLELGPDGSRFTWQGAHIQLGLPGRFNVSNALAAATAAVELGATPAQVAEGLAQAGPVAGRFERIDEGQAFLAAVDYAHTPDGLVQVLEAAHELVEGQVILVFGAGGDRDPSKRPAMGEAAARLADVVILTTDNPRSEDPDAIMSQVRSGMDDPPDLRVIPDRRQAIGAGVAQATSGDVLIVAGKGHETMQVVGRSEHPFDDRTVLREALRSIAADGSHR